MEKLLGFLAGLLERTTHIQFCMLWVEALLRQHGESLKERSASVMATLRALLKSMTLRHTELAKVCDHNKYLLRYIETLRELKLKRKGANEVSSEADDEMPSDVDSEDMLMGT